MMYNCKEFIEGKAHEKVNTITLRKKCVLVDRVINTPTKIKISSPLGERAKSYLLSKFDDGFYKTNREHIYNDKNLLQLVTEISQDDGYYYFKMWRVSNIKDLVTLLVYSKPELIGFVKEPSIQMSWMALENSMSYSRVLRVNHYIQNIERFYENSGEVVERNRELSLLFDSMADDKLEPHKENKNQRKRVTIH